MPFFKCAQNLPKNDIHVKQESNPPFLGIVGDKKWSPFSDLGFQSPNFWHLKTADISDFGYKKIGLQTPKFENGDHFLSPIMLE